MRNKPIKINKALTLVHFNNLILSKLKSQGINCWVAGGALRDYFTEIPLTTDCDIYFPNATEFNKAKNYFLSKGGKIVWESENGMKVSDNGQTFDLIKIFRANPTETINQFDFTISMFATDGKDIFYGDNSIKDLQDRKLVLNNLIMPLSSLRRVLKHYKKGYTMPAEEQKKLYHLLKSMPYDDSDDLLNANGSSGEGISPPSKTNTAEPPVVEKPDYLKYALIGGAILVVGYVLLKKFNKSGE